MSITIKRPNGQTYNLSFSDNDEWIEENFNDENIIIRDAPNNRPIANDQPWYRIRKDESGGGQTIYTINSNWFRDNHTYEVSFALSAMRFIDTKGGGHSQTIIAYTN